MTKIGIVGAGGMGSLHATKYKLMPDAEVVGVFDHKEERTTRFAERFSVRRYTSEDELLADADAVDVCTPTPSHAEHVMRAAKAKKAIFVEKPLARTLDQCREAMRVVRENGVICIPGHVLRTFSEFARAHRLVADGAIGTPAAIRTRRGGHFPRTIAEWYNDFEQSGGVMLDLLVHDFDWIRWTFGPIERVYARALTPRNLDHMDYALVTLKLRSGAVAHVEGTWLDPAGFRVTFEVAGDKGLIDFDSRRSPGLTVVKAQTEPGSRGVTIPESPMDPKDDPYYLELRHFLDCVHSDTSPCITMEDGYEAVKIALAALESAQTGRVVTITEGEAA